VISADPTGVPACPNTCGKHARHPEEADLFTTKPSGNPWDAPDLITHDNQNKRIPDTCNRSF